MDWIEVRIFTTTEGIEPINGILVSLGIQGMIIEDSKDLDKFLAGETAARWDYIDEEVLRQREKECNIRIYLADNNQGREQYQRLQASLNRLKEENIDKVYGRLEVELTDVKEEDWANNWKAYFKPFNVGQKLVIKPSWENWPESKDRKILEIDPGSSFGTGQHQTTQLCLEQLETVIKPGDHVLDLGCGSGILFIAALLLGAKSAVAVDVEENSAKVAADNAKQNSLSNQSYQTFVGDIIKDQALRKQLGYGQNGFDIVVANIVADVILAMSPYFAGFIKPEGYLLVSGIIGDRLAEVKSRLANLGFILLDKQEKVDWNAMIFKKDKQTN